MTMQELGRNTPPMPEQRGAMETRPLPRRLDESGSPLEGPSEDGALGALFESSPDLGVSTSAAAVVAFLAGLSAILTAPFSLTMALSIGLAAVALVTSVVGLARASKATVAGGLLASLALVLSLATAALIGLRYAGIDTAFGDGAQPTLTDWLAALNDLVPAP
jgi:hypothetical protein